MENNDRDLIEKVLKSNSELKHLYREHQALEQKLSRYESMRFLTPHEEMQIKQLKKRKLFGVDKMMRIVSTDPPREHV